MNAAVSSTVTSPRSAEPAADRPLDADGSGRSLTKVSVSAETPVIRRPVTNCARSAMCADVAERAGSGQLPAQPPDERELRIDDPVLQVHRPHVPDLAEPPVGDERAQERRGRDPPVVEPAHRPDPVGPGLGRGGRHLPRLVGGVGERLLAQHVLAGGQRGQGDLGVAVTGRTDVDDVDVVALDELAPVGRPALPAELLGGLGDGGLAAPADRGHRRSYGQVVDPVHGAPGERVRRAHERVADHPDPQLTV
jgi:hypothetical protein